MLRRPIGAIFHQPAAAEAARTQLLAAGVPGDQIYLDLLPAPPWHVLEGHGIPGEVARLYADQIRGGDSLLVVRGTELPEAEACRLLAGQGGVVLTESGATESPESDTWGTELEIGD